MIQQMNWAQHNTPSPTCLPIILYKQQVKHHQMKNMEHVFWKSRQNL